MTKKERLRIYKRALEIIQREEYVYRLNDYGLCLLLPCIWLNLDSFMDCFRDNKGVVFSHYDTPKYFPEFGKYNWRNSKVYAKDRNKWRISTLKKIISSYNKP